MAFQSSESERRDQSLEPAGDEGVGEISVGAGTGCGFGVGFLAEATAGVDDGWGDGRTAGAAAFAGADAAREVPRAGSGVMMLTGGVDAAEGKSALVGLPVGTEDG
jgi:hypothetical protein